MTRVYGLGCMGLSAVHVHLERAEEAIVSAIEAGVRLLDTADVYAPDAGSVGHNERLVGRVVRTRDPAVSVVTKGGLVRQGKRWRPDGRAKHLKAACEASLKRLGVEAIDVYLLHTPDPSVPIETSARALGALKKAGKVRSIGVSNVTVGQLEAARAVAPIEWVQVEMGPLGTTGFESGVAEYARTHGLRLLAHRPFGASAGVKRLARDPALKEAAERHGVSPTDLALAWLYDLDGALIALPGATRRETAVRSVPQVKLTDQDRTELDRRFPHGRLLRVPRAQRRPPGPRGDVVIVMGIPGAGKTRCADGFEQARYLRLNRDEHGGSLVDLIPRLEKALKSGRRRIVLDNTYPTRAMRNRVIEAAWRGGAPARCIFLDTSLEQAQVNVVRRMLDRHGRLLEEKEVAGLGDDEPNTFLPRVQYAFRERLEAPIEDEGFETVERRPFVPTPRDGRPAILVDADQMLWDEALEPRGDAPWASLKRRSGDFFIAALSWQPTLGTGERDAAEIARAHARLVAKLGFRLPVEVCPHAPGPPRCWCRRPLPGLGLLLEYRHQLALARSYLVGTGPANRGFADRLGLQMRAHPDLCSVR